MRKIELLAPAGNLEKARLALLYGADAVYVGGKMFSLRARASNFDVSDIEELCAFAKELNKKVYVRLFDGYECKGTLYSTNDLMKRTNILDMKNYYYVGNDIRDNGLRFRKSHITNIRIIESRV